MATDLGKAYVQIVPSAKGISGSITKELSGEASSAGTKAGGLFSKMFKSPVAKGAVVAGAALSAGLAVGTKALMNGIKATAEYGDSIDKMSQKLGLSAESYQKWDYVMKISGTDMQSMTVGLKTLTNKLDDAKNGNTTAQAAFEKLGISMKDISTMSREDLFAASIKGLQGMADSTERAALANDLFGRSGQNLAPLFNTTAEATEDLMKQAEKYGMVMSDDAVKASAAFQDSLTTMQMTITGLKNRMMAEFLPAATMITDGLGKIFAGDLSGIDDIADGIKGIADKLVENGPVIKEAAIKIGGYLLEGLLKLIEKIPETIGQITRGLSEKLQDGESRSKMIEAAKNFILNFGQGIIEAMPDVLVFVWELIKAIVQTLWEARSEILGHVADFIYNNLLVKLAEGWEAIKVAVSEKIASMVQAVKDWFAQMKTAISQKLQETRQNIADKFAAIKSNIVSKAAEIVTNVRQKFSDAKQAISDQMNAAKDKVKSIIDKVKGFFKFKISWPHIPVPHFSISPSGWKVADLLEGVIPKLSIKWYAKGGIFDKPTVLSGLGEAGPEAALPLDTFWDRLDNWGSAIIDGMAVVASGMQDDKDITITTYLYPNGPKMDEYTYKSYNRGKVRFGDGTV